MFPFHITIVLIVGSALSSGMIYEVMKEMPILINENDLHVSQVRLAYTCLLCAISTYHH